MHNSINIIDVLQESFLVWNRKPPWSTISSLLDPLNRLLAVLEKLLLVEDKAQISNNHTPYIRTQSSCKVLITGLGLFNDLEAWKAGGIVNPSSKRKPSPTQSAFGVLVINERNHTGARHQTRSIVTSRIRISPAGASVSSRIRMVDGTQQGNDPPAQAYIEIPLPNNTSFIGSPWLGWITTPFTEELANGRTSYPPVIHSQTFDTGGMSWRTMDSETLKDGKLHYKHRHTSSRMFLLFHPHCQIQPICIPDEMKHR